MYLPMKNFIKKEKRGGGKGIAVIITARIFGWYLRWYPARDIYTEKG